MKINLFGSNGPDYNVLNDEINEEANKDDAGGLVDETENNTAIYQSPNKETNENNEEQGLDNMINRADDFLEQGDAELKYDKEALQTFSRTMYNILLSVGVAVAAIVGGILGIKFMSASVEGKINSIFDRMCSSIWRICNMEINC